MHEFSIWVDRRGTVRMLCLPMTAERPTDVYVFESFADESGTTRTNSAGIYELITAEDTNSVQVSDKRWLKEGFVPLGTRSFTVFDLRETLRNMGIAFMTEVLNYVERAPLTVGPSGIPGEGDLDVVVKLIRHLHDFDSADERLPDIMLFHRPAVAPRFAF